MTKSKKVVMLIEYADGDTPRVESFNNVAEALAFVKIEFVDREDHGKITIEC